MKILKKIVLTAIVLSILSCQDDSLFKKTNTNEEAFASIAPNLLLTTIQASLSGQRLDQWRANLIYGEGFIQHLGGSDIVSNYGGFFNKNSSYEYALWQTNYGNGIVRNLVGMQEITKNKSEFNNINAISKILKVMIFQRLTDTYGAVPFSEAGLGFYENIRFPKYDDQQDIYNHFFILLDEAYNQLNESPEADKITGDNFYNGNISKWKKLSNSLRLRCAMRICLVDPDKARTEIQAAFENGLFEDNEDNCFTSHDDTEFNVIGAESNGNGFSHALRGNGSVQDHPTEILLEKLEGDPRKELWFLPGNSGKIEGISSNNLRWDHPGGPENLGILQPYLYANDAPYMHISYSETQLLLAEAVQRGFLPGNSLNYYKKGIEAAVLQWTVYGANINKEIVEDFISDITLTPDNEIEEIATQQWLTLFLNGMEAYANHRRLDLPILNPVTRTDSETNGIMPKRFSYPGEEAITNETNYNMARAKYPNGWLSPIWWDIN